MTNPNASPIPSPSVPLIGPDGRLAPVWFQFFVTMFARTGGLGGINDGGEAAEQLGTVQAQAVQALSQIAEMAQQLALLMAPPAAAVIPDHYDVPAATVAIDQYVPPSTADAASRGFFPLQWPTQNPRGDGSWADLWVPYQTTFVDNVLTLRNNSQKSDGSIYGNAAICMLDAGGNERGAFGYSRNSAIQPTGYYADTVYIEYGDAFAGDNNPSSFKLICTMATTSPWFPGTSFVAMEANTQTGATIIRARGGQPISLSGGYTLTEDFSAGYTGRVRQVLGGMSNTSWRIRERDTADWAAWTTNCADNGTVDSATASSWKTQQGYGSGSDAWRVCRAPAGSSTFLEFMRIDASGRAIFSNSQGIGYGAGSGGTVTQATSKTTGVTLNRPSGQITMNNAALAGGAIALFYVANSCVTTNDVVVVNLEGGMSYSPNYTIRVTSVNPGGFYIVLKNETTGSLSEAVVFNFAVIKGSTA